MDDYKLLHMIAEGPLGPTLLVRDKLSGDKCVIKKVECRDYTQALQAYSQLKKVNGHTAICSYRQFFVHWEREAQAVFLCTVTDYHELGNLTSFIERQRTKREPLDEQLLKRWVGQLAEGLSHAHSNDVLHCNIKPNNILLSSHDSLVLGDFAVPVVMENMREVARKRGGTLRWLPPEVLTAGVRVQGGGTGSEKTDVWSLGCVLLELATCGFMDGSHYSVLLQRLHKDPSVLQEVLERVEKFYSSEVCQVLESCLRRSLEQRPSISELMKRPAMLQCLALSSGLSTDSADLSADSAEEEAPDVDDLRELYAHPEGIRDILKTMQACPNDRQVLLQCCSQLWNHTLSESGYVDVWRCGGVEVICDTLSAHLTDVRLCNVSCSLLWSLSLRETLCPALATCGAVDLLLRCLHLHPKDSEMTRYVCLALGSLARSNEVSAFHVIDSESHLAGIPIILNTIKCSESCCMESLEAITELWEALCGYGDVKRELESLGAVQELAQLREQLVGHQ